MNQYTEKTSSVDPMSYSLRTYPVNGPTTCHMCSGEGQFHTNEFDPAKPNKSLRQYSRITYSDILAMVADPQQVEKIDARWMIPSTVMSRSFKKQEADGEYLMLWADLDENPPSLDKVLEVLEDYDCAAYTSRSATSERPKCRVLIPLLKPLSASDWAVSQKVLNAKFSAHDVTPDCTNERAAQLCYLPNRGEYYDSRIRDKVRLLDPMSDWSAEMNRMKHEIDRSAREMQILKEAAAKRRDALAPSVSPDLIGAFNMTHSLPELLLKAGYEQYGNSFRHPRSESGSFSASVRDGRVHSLSSADPLYTGGGGGGAHDAFSVFTVLFCNGDRDQALRLAGDKWVTIDGMPWNAAAKLRHSPIAQRAKLSDELDIGAMFSDLELRAEDVERMAEADFLIPDMIVRGHVAAYVSPGNGGKTTIFIYLAEKLAADGVDVIYVNVDGSPGDLKRHYAHAHKHGYKVIAPDAKVGKSTEDVLQILSVIAAGSVDGSNVVIIIDTLKKFLDVINKKQSKEFYKLLRAITVKGATICLLGHTNKYAGDDGKQIFEGTADLRNDLDELIYLDGFKNESDNTLEVTTRPDKVRAEFSPKSFVIDLDDRSVTEPSTVFNILTKDERELLDLIKSAIVAGHQSQKDIISFVEPKTAHRYKKIRHTLIQCARGDNSEITVESTGRGKDLRYSLRDLGCEFNSE